MRLLVVQLRKNAKAILDETEEVDVPASSNEAVTTIVDTSNGDQAPAVPQVTGDAIGAEVMLSDGSLTGVFLLFPT
jgi:hypothetical protein